MPAQDRVRQSPPAISPLTPNLARQKRELRVRCLALRESTAMRSPDAAQTAVRRLLDALAAQPGDTVAAYRAIRWELDPGAALEALHLAQTRLCLPVVAARDAPLAFRSWSPGEALVRGAFGVEIPEAGEKCVPELMVVPLLAWDRTGARLGYGGGFYDRTLDVLRRAGRLRLAIGFAYAAQEVPQVPRDTADARLDALVTERETLVWRRTCGS